MGSLINRISQEQSHNIQSINKEIYFLILSQSEDKINFFDSKCLSEINPEIIYYKRIKNGKDSFFFNYVFKLTLNEKEENKEWSKYKIQYEIGEELYDILFDIKENIFIYELKLQKYNKYISNITKKDIEQNQIPIQNKLDIFLKALIKNNDNNKIEILYEEGIKLYKSKKIFHY